MSKKTYDILKWTALTGLPAVSALVGSIGTATGWEHTGITITIIVAIDTFLGSCIGVSSYNHTKAIDTSDTPTIEVKD